MYHYPNLNPVDSSFGIREPNLRCNAGAGLVPARKGIPRGTATFSRTVLIPTWIIHALFWGDRKGTHFVAWIPLLRQGISGNHFQFDVLAALGVDVDGLAPVFKGLHEIR